MYSSSNRPGCNVSLVMTCERRGKQQMSQGVQHTHEGGARGAVGAGGAQGAGGIGRSRGQRRWCRGGLGYAGHRPRLQAHQTRKRGLGVLKSHKGGHKDECNWKDEPSPRCRSPQGKVCTTHCSPCRSRCRWGRGCRLHCPECGNTCCGQGQKVGNTSTNKSTQYCNTISRD